MSSSDVASAIYFGSALCAFLSMITPEWRYGVIRVWRLALILLYAAIPVVNTFIVLGSFVWWALGWEIWRKTIRLRPSRSK